MAHELTIEGKTYISSKRASEISGYAQDYIGQLARKQLIDAKRIGGLWYVFMDSLTGYKQQAEQYKPQPPIFTKEQTHELDTAVSFDGKEYLSASRAAEQTGYSQDYVGQLARSGSILSQQIGNRWYVERESILSHKRDKDGMLAAVQREAVGLSRPAEIEKKPSNADYSNDTMTYYNESVDLLPNLRERYSVPETRLPIRTMTPIEAREIEEVVEARPQHSASLQPRMARRRQGGSGLYLTAGALATIVVVLTVGFSTIRGNSIYTVAHSMRNAALAGGAAGALNGIASFIEQHFVPTLNYTRK